MSESEADEEIEEMYIYVDLEMPTKGEFEPGANATFKAIGLDSDEPFVQIDDGLFRGVYAECDGTMLFFEDDPRKPSDDDEDGDRPLRYRCLAAKTLRCQKVLLKPKTERQEERPDEEDKGLANTLEPSAATCEEAVERLSQYLAQMPPDDSQNNPRAAKQKLKRANSSEGYDS